MHSVDFLISVEIKIPKSYPCTGLDRLLELQEVETPRFQDSRHIKVARLSGLLAGRLYPQEISPGIHFLG
jgi:hypothetical protein